MIRLTNIEKSYRHGVSQTFVLRRVTAEIAQGDFVSIMGPSGAGKSTLLHILGMHDSRVDRRVLAARSSPIHALSDKDRLRLQKQHIGFVFQSYHLLDNLTVYENIDLPLSYRDVKRTERQGMVGRHPRSLQHRRQEGPLSEPAVGRPAAAGRHRPRRGRQAVDHPGRRADRQPALGSGPRDHGAVRQAERARAPRSSR